MANIRKDGNKAKYVSSWSFWLRADVVSRRKEQLCQRSTNSNITDSLFLVLPILYPFNYRIFQENTFYNWNFRTAIVLKGSGPFKLIDFLSCLRSKLLYLIAALFQTCLLKISEL